MLSEGMNMHVTKLHISAICIFLTEVHLTRKLDHIGMVSLSLILSLCRSRHEHLVWAYVSDVSRYTHEIMSSTKILQAIPF
jgi:hypothetical protein